jgi:hypothetical protein
MANSHLLRIKACQIFLLDVEYLQTAFAFLLSITTFICWEKQHKYRYWYMRALETLNRFLVGILLFLVCIQASLLFVMKNMKDQAQVRLVENETTVEMECGKESFSEENYWDPLAHDYNFVKTCQDMDCEKSSLYWQDNTSQKNLHVVSVKSAPTMKWNEQDAGGTIKVRVTASKKPQVLALVSQTMHEWKLIVDKDANLEKIIVATPTIVWLDGVPEKTKIEYLPKDKMCSYPYAWEEVHNPDNQFRILIGALKKITGVFPSSFQGGTIGKEFVLPKSEELLRRSIASIEGTKAPSFASKVSWVRNDDRVVAQKVEETIGAEKTLVELPEKTEAVALASQGTLFISSNYYLQAWNSDSGKFETVHAPLTMSAVEDVTAIAPDKSNPYGVFVFNERHGGELYYYDHKKTDWTLVKSGIPAQLRALYYDSEEQKIYGLVGRGQNFTDIYMLSRDGAQFEKKPLVAKIPFDPIRWRWELAKPDGSLTLLMHTPLEPQGEPVRIAY